MVRKRSCPAVSHCTAHISQHSMQGTHRGTQIRTLMRSRAPPHFQLPKLRACIHAVHCKISVAPRGHPVVWCMLWRRSSCGETLARTHPWLHICKAVPVMPLGVCSLHRAARKQTKRLMQDAVLQTTCWQTWEQALQEAGRLSGWHPAARHHNEPRHDITTVLNSATAAGTHNLQLDHFAIKLHSADFLQARRRQARRLTDQQCCTGNSTDHST